MARKSIEDTSPSLRDPEEAELAEPPKLEPVAPVSVDPARVVSLTDKIVAEKGEAPFTADEIQKPYWIGIKPESKCPFEKVSAGGQDFPLFEEKVDVDPITGGTIRFPVKGKIVRFTEGRVKRIVEGIAHKYIRPVGGNRHDLKDDRTQGFRRQPGDVPLAKYIYFIEVSEESARAWQGRVMSSNDVPVAKSA